MPQIFYQSAFAFLIYQNPHAVNVLRVAEQNKMGPLWEVCHGGGKGRGFLKVFPRAWLSWVSMTHFWQLPPNPEILPLSLFFPCWPAGRGPTSQGQVEGGDPGWDSRAWAGAVVGSRGGPWAGALVGSQGASDKLLPLPDRPSSPALQAPELRAEPPAALRSQHLTGP